MGSWKDLRIRTKRTRPFLLLLVLTASTVASIAQVADVIQKINDIRQVIASAVELSRMASELRSLVGQFKTWASGSWTSQRILDPKESA